ncbi:MAG: hypothetical protein PHX08_14975 [Lachnospiraceae bacterium]|nr:hypothetical protein [Lachnospiraceae bacterium]
MNQIKLNIIMSYPVQWSKHKVMRDFIQNFFDAIGPEEFNCKFQYTYKNNTLVMSSNHSFGKEWLFYMGASTKRNSERLYAGKFGEGFKIASLVAYRDFNLAITMESKDWILKVTEADGIIDGKQVSYLAYDFSERGYEDTSILTLEGVNEELFDAFQYELHTFYYEGNPYFGRCIVKENEYAVYESVIQNSKKKGILYAGFQQRKVFSSPVIICNNTYQVSQGDDRDRDDLRTGDATRCMVSVLENLNAKQAMEVLELFRNCWHGLEGIGGYDFFKRPVILTLISRMRCECAAFSKKYKDILVAGCCRKDKSERTKIAITWYRNSKYYGKREVVLREFNQLNIDTIEELCKKEDGFQVSRLPCKKEQQYLDILESLATQIFSKLFVYEYFPQYSIIISENAPVKGLAQIRKTYRNMKNEMGVRVQYDISFISLRDYIFQKDKFEEAVSTYMHELLHQFGGDSSMRFRKMLLEMNSIILEETESFDQFRTEWRKVG